MRKRVSSHANICLMCSRRHPAVVLPAAAGGGSSRAGSSRAGDSATRARSRRSADVAGSRREGARGQGRQGRGNEGRRRRWPQSGDRLAGGRSLQLRLPLLDRLRVGCKQRGGWRRRHEAAFCVHHVVRVRARHLLAANARRRGAWATGNLTAATTTAVDIDGERTATKALPELLAEHCSAPALRHRLGNSPVHIVDNCSGRTGRSSPARPSLEAHNSAALAFE